MTQSFWFIVKQTLKGWPVIPDVLEQVEGFLKSVGLIVFSDHHVIATARYHEDDGRHICKDQRFKPPATKTSLHYSVVTLFLLLPLYYQILWTDNLPLKHWIHFRRSSRWPPTSNILGQRKSNTEHWTYREIHPQTLHLGELKLNSKQNSLEIDFVYLKGCLKDPRCQHSASQQILKNNN